MLLDAVAGILLQTHCVFSIRSDQSRMGVRGCVCVYAYACMRVRAYVSMLECMRNYVCVYVNV